MIFCRPNVTQIVAFTLVDQTLPSRSLSLEEFVFRAGILNYSSRNMQHSAYLIKFEIRCQRCQTYSIEVFYGCYISVSVLIGSSCEIVRFQIVGPKRMLLHYVVKAYMFDLPEFYFEKSLKIYNTLADKDQDLELINLNIHYEICVISHVAATQ